MTIDVLLEITRYLILISVLVDSLETLAKRQLYRRGQIFSHFLVLPKLRVSSRLGRTRIYIFDRAFLPLIWVKTIAALVSMVYISAPALILILVIQWLSFARHKSSNSAADQIQLIVLFGYVVAQLSPDLLLRQMAMSFIAVNLLISYITAGYFKLTSKTWQSGNAMRVVLATDTYGDSKFYFNLLNKPVMFKVMAWATICFDFFLPFVAMMHPVGSIVFIVLGVTFHAGNAYFMGLNNFLLAFAAGFPSVYYLSLLIHTTLFNGSFGL